MGASGTTKRSKRPCVVAELGNDWIKLAEVDRSRGGVGFSKLHLLRADGNPEALRTALYEMLKPWRDVHASAIACLPRQAVNIRMLELPSSDPAEIADMVELQSGKQTPYSSDEVVYNYSVIGPGRQGYTRVLMAIVQRPLLRQRFSILEDAGIEIARMTVSSEAVLNWQKQAGAGGPGAFLLVDIDASFSDAIVFSEQGAVFTRSIMIGASHLFADLEKWKEKFVREIKQSLDSCMAEFPGLSVSKLLIAGAGQNLPALVTYLGPQLGLHPECVDSLQSLKRFPQSPSLRDPEYREISLTALAGLALGEDRLQLNLMPDTVAAKRAMLQRARALTTFAIMLATFLVAGSLLATTNLFMKAAHLRSILRQTEQLEPEVRKVEAMQTLIRTVAKRQDARFAPLNLLREMSKSTPANVYVEAVELNAEKEQFAITGVADAIKDVRAFVQTLDQSAVFKNVVEGQTRKDEQGRFKFQVVCSLESAK